MPWKVMQNYYYINLLYDTKHEKIRLNSVLQLAVRTDYHCLRAVYINAVVQFFYSNKFEKLSRITEYHLLFPKVKKTHGQI